jgi:hypothetical protein
MKEHAAFLAKARDGALFATDGDRNAAFPSAMTGQCQTLAMVRKLHRRQEV